MNLKIGKTFLILAIIALSVLPASAYQIPQELRADVPNGYDHEVFYLSLSHAGEPWADYIINDMGYKYAARNLEQLLLRMEFQKEQVAIKRNNMVRVNE